MKIFFINFDSRGVSYERQLKLSLWANMLRIWRQV